MKVLNVAGGNTTHRWLRHHDPLNIGWYDSNEEYSKEINNPNLELTGKRILSSEIPLAQDYNRPHWYSLWEPGKHNYTCMTHRVGEGFGNYLYSMAQLVNCPIPIDRTDGNEYNQFNYHTTPIPKVEDGWNKNIEDLFIERAEEFWAMDRPVRLWWSGGIDSTTALVALLRTKKPENELIVFCGPPCKEENPHFWSLLERMDDITMQFNKKENIFDFSNFNDGSINITGEPGDPFYGTFVVEKHIDDLHAHWTDIFKWDDVQYVFRNTDDCRMNWHRPKFMEFVEKFNAKCPFEIRTPFDFTWWVAFAVKWQWIEHRIYAQMTNPSKWDNMQGFYNSQEIQKWSIHNHDLKHKGTWKSYKYPSKDFIYKYDGNADYRDNKTKEKSLVKTYPMRAAPEKGYGLPQLNNLIMTDGSYHKANYSGNDYGYGYDPDINFYDKWDIYNKPVWDEWKRQL